MVLRRTRALSCSAALIASLAASATWAQDVDVQAGDTAVQIDRSGVQVDGQRGQRLRQSDRQQPRTPATMNRQITQWLIVDQQNIVSLAQYGLQRTQTPQVRELAETIARDHEALGHKLNDVGLRESSTSQPADLTDAPREEQTDATREARRDAVRDQDGDRNRLENLGDRLEDGVERLADTAERVIGDARQGVDRVVGGDRQNRLMRGVRWIEIHREITKKLEDVARQDLQGRQGYEFDAAFVGMLIASHLQQEATLDVLSSRASGDLVQTLDEALASVKQHRAQAEQIMGQIKR